MSISKFFGGSAAFGSGGVGRILFGDHVGKAELFRTPSGKAANIVSSLDGVAIKLDNTCS